MSHVFFLCFQFGRVHRLNINNRAMACDLYTYIYTYICYWLPLVLTSQLLITEPQFFGDNFIKYFMSFICDAAGSANANRWSNIYRYRCHDHSPHTMNIEWILKLMSDAKTEYIRIRVYCVVYMSITTMCNNNYAWLSGQCISPECIHRQHHNACNIFTVDGAQTHTRTHIYTHMKHSSLFFV